MTINAYEHTLIETELHEIDAAEAEMNLYIEDSEGQLNVKLSRRSYDIISAALGLLALDKRLDGEDQNE